MSNLFDVFILVFDEFVVEDLATNFHFNEINSALKII